MTTKVNTGEVMRAAAAERIKNQVRVVLKAEMTGEDIREQVFSQGLEPRFDESSEFQGYFDIFTGKKVTTSMPPLLGDKRAEYDAAVEAYKTNNTNQKEEDMTTAAPTKKTAKTKEPKEPAAPRKNALTGKIKILSEENPKREGTASHKKFAKYKNGMTVEEAIKAGVDTGTIRWDVRHKFISLE